MRSSSGILGLALLAGAAGPLNAQNPDWLTRLLEASYLPVSTTEARKEGASSSDIQQVLDVLRREKVPPDEARQVIDEERAARREHGPVDNFGAFVQARLQQGLRGRDLAAAIRAEHQARGKGKGHGQPREGEDKAGQRPEDRGGKPQDKGRKPEDRGKPEDRPANPQN